MRTFWDIAVKRSLKWVSGIASWQKGINSLLNEIHVSKTQPTPSLRQVLSLIILLCHRMNFALLRKAPFLLFQAPRFFPASTPVRCKKSLFLVHVGKAGPAACDEILSEINRTHSHFLCLTSQFTESLWLHCELSLLPVRDFPPEINCLFTVYLTSDFLSDIHWDLSTWYSLPVIICLCNMGRLTWDVYMTVSLVSDSNKVSVPCWDSISSQWRHSGILGCFLIYNQ